MREIIRWLGIAIVMVVLTACGGGSSGTGSYTLTESNHALMGPLKEAKVSIYRLVDMNQSIEQTTTDSMGTFSVELNGIDDDEIVLVQVNGGIDIDADDDGVINAILTSNKGNIHALVSAKLLREGQANVTLVSEIVYQFSKHLLGKISNDDLFSIMNVIGAKLLKNGVSEDGSVYKKLISGFTPIQTEFTEALSFDYFKLISGEDSLASVIYAGDKDVEAKVAELFQSVLSIGDSSLLALKNQVKLSLMPPIEADVTSSNTPLFMKQENNTSKLSAYIEKGKDATFSIIVNDGYKVLRWHGCDTVSSDLKTCFLSNVQEDSVITPVVVSDEIIVNPDIVIKDLTGAAININNNTYNCEVDSANVNLQTVLENVEVGDVIVNKVEPVFFKKVTAVTKIDTLHYTYETEFIALEEVITQGHLSSSSSTSVSTQNAKLISSNVVYIAPDGKQVALHSDDSNIYDLDFSRLTKVVAEKDFPIKEYELEEGVKVKGGIKVGLGFEIDMDWKFIGGLRYLHVEPDITLTPNISLSIEGEKKFGGADSEYNMGLIRRSQVFLIGVVPIVVSEDIRVSLGAEGSVKASYSIGADASFGIGFPFTWNEKSGLYFETVDKKLTFNVDVAKYTLEAEAGGYLNVMPTVNVYGFGIGLANKVGIYGKVAGTTGLTLSYGTEGAKAEAAKAYAEIFLQYQPEFRLITPEITSGNTFFKDLKEKFSAKFPPLLKVTKTLWKNEVVLDTTIVIPGKLEVVGYNYIDEIVQGDSLKKSLVYILKNTGGEDLYWEASMLTKKMLFTDEMIYPSSGKLSPDDSIEIHVEIDQSEVIQVGEQKELLNFFSSATDFTLADPFMINIMDRIIPKASFGLNLMVHSKLSPIEDATLEVEGTEVQKMTINYELSTDDIDGYIIYKADYNQTNQFCYDNYEVFTTLADKTQSQYSVGLDALMQSTDTTRKIEAGHAYCFNVVSYKDENELHSTSPLMEMPMVLNLPSTLVDLNDGLIADYEFNNGFINSVTNIDDSTKWEHSQDVNVEDGYLKLINNYDNDPKRAVNITLNTLGINKLVIEKKVKLTTKDDYTLSSTYFSANSNDQKIYIEYNNYHYNNGDLSHTINTNNTEHFYIYNRWNYQDNQDNFSYQLSELLEPIWDEWFYEKIVIDYVQQTIDYSVSKDGIVFDKVSISNMTFEQDSNTTLSLRAWDWSGGSEHTIDWLKIYKSE